MPAVLVKVVSMYQQQKTCPYIQNVAAGTIYLTKFQVPYLDRFPVPYLAKFPVPHMIKFPIPHLTKFPVTYLAKFQFSI